VVLAGLAPAGRFLLLLVAVAAGGGNERSTHLGLTLALALFAMTSISPSLQHQLERLSPDERIQVGALLAALEDSATHAASAPRRPGGLLGKMRTHADFDAPMAEEFLIP
jgi:hypothetical protein